MSKLKIEYMNIDKLIPYINNPRDNKNAVDKVAASIKEFGFKNPIIVDKENVIIAGHTRLLASRKLDLKEVPILRVDDLTDEQIKAFRLADNKVSEASEWDFNLLAGELHGLDFDMSAFGFDLESYDVGDFGTDFTLPSGDKSDIEQMTFTLHKEQAELIRYAISITKNEVVETFGNSNSNGNAIYEVVRQWAEQRK